MLFHPHDALKEGLRWNIGNGRSVSIWDDKWIPSKKNFKVNTPHPLNVDVNKVCELMHANEGSWNRELVSSIFDEEDCIEIMKIPISRGLRDDRLVWHHAPNGVYNAKLGYQQGTERAATIRDIGTSIQMNNEEGNWASIWGLNCQPKIKHFIWKACHNVVSTNEALAKRHRSRNACCNRCGEMEETLEHLIFFCPLSLAIWRASGFGYTPSPIGFGSFAMWWLAMVQLKDNSSQSMDLELLASLVWGIWKARNKIVFDGDTIDPIQCWMGIEEQLIEFRQAQNRVRSCNEIVSSRSDCGDRLIEGWEPPDVDAVKINCDAAFDKTSCRTGIAVVARNSEGVVVGGSNEQTFAPNAFVAECLALRLGSQIAEQRGWESVTIESDCRDAIRMINGERKVTWEAEAIIQDIQTVGNIHCFVNFCHLGRNRNKLADWLAKATLRGTCPDDWVNIMPIDLYNFMNQ